MPTRKIKAPPHQPCIHPEHRPPMHMVYQPGATYEHICPRCGAKTKFTVSGPIWK